MTVPADYRIAFTAVGGEPLGADAAGALAAALEAMPSLTAMTNAAVRRRPVSSQPTACTAPTPGMADAARDGSRLAKEALKVAGQGHTQLAELAVTLMPDGAGRA